MLIIVNWSNRFENSKTRILQRLSWVPMETGLDDDGFVRLISHPDGPAHFGVWNALVRIAARCAERGTLTKSDGTPHDSASLALVCRIPALVVEEALVRLVGELGWIANSDKSLIRHFGAAIRPEGAAERAVEGRKEEKEEGEGARESAPPPPSLPTPSEGAGMFDPESLAFLWNAMIDPAVRRSVALDHATRERARHRIGEHPDPDWWSEIFTSINRSDFLCGRCEPGTGYSKPFKLTFDWILLPANLQKVADGFYDGDDTGSDDEESAVVVPMDPAKRAKLDAAFAAPNLYRHPSRAPKQAAE